MIVHRKKMNSKNKHILIENIIPSLEGGSYPVKEIVGANCEVEADIFRDGTPSIKAMLNWRSPQGKQWNELPMKDLGNDHWRADFALSDLGLYEFKIRAWTEDEQGAIDSEESSPTFQIVVDRPLSRFGSWYELFVRSQGADPHKSGTFQDAERRLPDIKEMGFDVVYLAPIHPIGLTARKGPNNALHAGPNDPGSPWGVGGAAGGHTAIEPAIGTLQDFDTFVQAASKLGLEIALDFAPHCSPDHPWVKEHPEWYYHRADGTIKCHENPPYVYEDVYPLNFDSPTHEALYDALRDVFLFWAQHGVRIFRVDNPHTKPVAFWGWVIQSVKEKYPDVIFLGEAFTREKMMKALSKVGFSQSYTYFIWRTTKPELTQYLTDLSHPELKKYFRPNFFVTTPDVLPHNLQQGGRPAFEMRLALATTLSPSYGIISGFELLENQAMPGTEEYANSEKYEIRIRDWNQPGHIKDLIRKLNDIRRMNPSLQRLENISFLDCENDQVLAYVKMTPDRSNRVMVVVNLDPHQTQETTIQIPMDKLGFSWEADFEVRDLMTDQHMRLNKSFFLKLDPHRNPFQIYQVMG